ncbi:MAG: hypothetical protein AAB733_01210 [Patescibacteria group bacterium]
MNWLYGNQNYSIFDSIWVLVHISSGILVGGFIGLLSHAYQRFRHRATALQVLLLALMMWEIVEGTLRWLDIHQPQIARLLKSRLYDGFFEYEHPVNIVSDLVVGFLGGVMMYVFITKSRFGKTLRRLPG